MGKKEEITDITRIKGLEWEKSSMPRLKQSSSPTFEHQTTIKPIQKKNKYITSYITFHK